ncbi:MAG: ATP12 family chaperone protein [Rubrimonas sp.]|uniref:ATP12 family chaperone protein n=1 Tax=Rubrimonas sp. TaxID=2036015 RepID=UPI002FDDEE26
MTARKRFWTEAAAVEAPEGWAVLLDGRPVRTPAGRPLAAPLRALAEGVASEWAAQGETLAPQTMPLTRALNTALDRVAPAQAQVVEDVAAYGASDLLCYRAAAPAELVAREAAAWDPPLAWARARHGAPLICAQGIAPVAQPPESLARLRAAVAACDAFALTALAELTSLSGSLVLGLAAAEGAMDAAEAWEASRVDEIWQIAQWGADAEAEAAAERRRAAFLDAARLAALLREAR